MIAQPLSLQADFAAAKSQRHATWGRGPVRWAGVWLMACAVLMLAAPSAFAQVYQWTNFVGMPGGLGNADGTGSAARFNFPSNLAVDSSGNLYVADENNHTIRKVTPGGTVSTLAGLAGSPGSSDGTGSAARFNYPLGVAVDGSGNVYVADSFNNNLRKITPAGVVSTLAGLTGSMGSSDGPGSDARFNNPQGVAVDGSGNVYVADTENHTIRMVTPAGVVTTLAGLAGSTGSSDGAGSAARFRHPYSVTLDGSGNLYVADTFNQTIRKVTPAGVVSTLAGLAGSMGSSDGTGSAARFYYPSGIAVDGSGNVYVADTENDAIRKVTPAGVVSTLAGFPGSTGSSDGTGSAARFYKPYGVTVDSSGNVYVADNCNHTLRKVTPSGVVSTLAGQVSSTGSRDGTGSAAQFNYPSSVASDGSGNLYAADTYNCTIRKVSPAGGVSTLAGLAGSVGSNDGTGSAAQFENPQGVAVDGSGNLYVSDAFTTIRKVTPAGVVSTLAGLAGNYGSNDGTGNAARFSGPTGVAVDASGNVYVADTNNQTIRKVTPAGVVSTLAGLAGSFGSSDGTGSDARFYNPSSVAVDSSGNVYVTDSYNQTIRKVTPAGVVTTLAGKVYTSGSTDGPGTTARFSSPYGIAVSASGYLYVADSGNATIRMISPGGVVSTVAGLAGSTGSTDGTGTAAKFSHPGGVAVDSNDFVYVADTGNGTIRKVASGNGAVTTLAGLAGNSGSSDGTGSAARFNGPSGVSVDGSGNVYVADQSNHTIRKVTPGGVVSTLGGLAGYSGSSDGTGSAARFKSPTGVAVDASGNLYVADTNNNRISMGTVPLGIAVQQPVGTYISLGGTQSFGAQIQGGTTSLTFTINNLGTQNLTGLTITKDGTNAADFTVTTSPTTPVSPGGSTTFTVQFAPSAVGAQTLTETAAIHIANNVPGMSPYDINLTGTALSYTQSTGNDGMSDAAKFMLAPLGFNWQMSQPLLVNAYFSNANAANLYTQTQYTANRTAGQNDVTSAPNSYSLYTLSQVQTLNASTPLLTKNPSTGQFKLTIGVQQTPSLSQPFTAFPFSAPNTSINAQGQMEFLFNASGNAAFFRVQAK